MWQTSLDLSTAVTKQTAHVYSSPTLIDIDADGNMDIVLGRSLSCYDEKIHLSLLSLLNLCLLLHVFAGTSTGNIYTLKASTGEVNIIVYLYAMMTSLINLHLLAVTRNSCY